MAGLGLQHFFYPGFRPVFILKWPVWMPGEQIFVYVSGLLLIACGAAIIFTKRPKQTMLILGAMLLMLLLVFHIATQLSLHPGSLGSWTDTLKLLALSGGAFVVAGSYPYYDINTEYQPSTAMKLAEQFIPLGSIFFSVMMIAFGIDHFLYVQFVVTLIPSWIPFEYFWTYFAGVALIGGGAAILFRIQLRLAGILTGVMMFLWLLILHIPRSIATPEVANGNEVTSVFEALAFSGIAFTLAYGYFKSSDPVLDTIDTTVKLS
jgi:uncharacterized membrane protein